MRNPIKLYKANFLLQDVPSEIEYRPVTILTQDDVVTRGVLYRRRGSKPRVGVHLMHPRTDQSQNYNIIALAMAGYAVLGRAGRWVNNDVATIHEQLMFDFAAGIDYLRKEVGCEQVVLLGNSGGSALAAMYQWQARTPPPGRLTTTAAGDPLDLNAVDLPPADGLAIIAGHHGEGDVMLKYLDPAVIDEADPVATDPELDMFDPANGYRPPPASSHYSSEFLKRFREAQHARMRRLDAIARHLILQERAARAAASLTGPQGGDEASLFRRQAGGAWHMVIYRTSADPATMDLSIEPDDRRIGSYLNVRPDIENFGSFGHARYLTPRAWLSTWSAFSTRARTLPCLARINNPTIIVHYAGDEGLRMLEAQALHDASAATDKNLVVVRHADHYGRIIRSDGSLDGQTAEGTQAIVDWMLSRFKP